jgi:hypothetical protein
MNVESNVYRFDVDSQSARGDFVEVLRRGIDLTRNGGFEEGSPRSRLAPVAPLFGNS